MRRPSGVLRCVSLVGAALLVCTVPACADDAPPDVEVPEDPPRDTRTIEEVEESGRELLRHLLECAAAEGFDVHTGYEFLEALASPDGAGSNLLECVDRLPEAFSPDQLVELLEERLR